MAIHHEWKRFKDSLPPAGTLAEIRDADGNTCKARWTSNGWKVVKGVPAGQRLVEFCPDSEWRQIAETDEDSEMSP